VVKQLPVGWVKVSKKDNGCLLCMNGHNSFIHARVRMADYAGDTEDLKESVAGMALGYRPIDSESGSFLFSNISWNADYYVCASNEKYRAYFYAVLEGCCIIFEMVTADGLLKTQFFPEVKRLMLAVDFTGLKKDNRFRFNGKVYNLVTPPTFHFNRLSTDERLIFFNSSGYLFVNVGGLPVGLVDFVESEVSHNYLGTAGFEMCIECAGGSGGVEWVRYRVSGPVGCLGYGTYFSQTVDGGTIVSYLYEKQVPGIKVTTLLRFSSG